MLTVSIILGISILLFIWGKYSPDVVAVLAMLSLYVSGILTLEQTLAGFSNPTVVMIAALFIIGEALSQSGWTANAGRFFIEKAGKSGRKLMIMMVSGAALLSAFVSNTGTVATFMPVTIAAAWKIGSVPSQFLIPLAFGANVGGLLTLTGTPPNIIVNNALIEAGKDGFSFFEFSLIGVPLFIVLLIYLYYVGPRLLPKHFTQNKPIDFDNTLNEWISAYGLEEGCYQMRVRSNSSVIGKTLQEARLDKIFGVWILHIEKKQGRPYSLWFPWAMKNEGYLKTLQPTAGTILQPNDILLVKGSPEAINQLMVTCRFTLQPAQVSKTGLREDLLTLEFGVVEMVVTPRSEYLNQRINAGAFFEKYNLQLLAASRMNRVIKDDFIQIRPGDSFLVRGTWSDIMALEDEKQNFVVCGSSDQLVKEVTQLNYKSWISFFSLILMVVLIAFNVLPGAIAAIISAGIPVITGCLTPRQAYRSITWISVVMIAAMIPMSTALQVTNLAQLAAGSLVQSIGQFGPHFLLGGVFLLTALFSQVINNSATAVLMAPIALGASAGMGISAEPFMIVVAISASTAFLTPIGTTTNAMVMSAGGYTFKDYFMAGSILLLFFFLLTIVLVPLIWPF